MGLIVYRKRENTSCSLRLNETLKPRHDQDFGICKGAKDQKDLWV